MLTCTNTYNAQARTHKRTYHLYKYTSWSRGKQKEDRLTHLEEVFRGAGVDTAILDLALLGEIVCRLYRRQHSFDGEERGEVGGVRRDDDEREKPPSTAHYTSRQRPNIINIHHHHHYHHRHHHRHHRHRRHHRRYRRHCRRRCRCRRRRGHHRYHYHRRRRSV